MRPPPSLLLAVLLTCARAGAQSPPPTPARAAPMVPPARTPIAAGLDYHLGPGGERCPGEEYLHQEIARRMGYDPLAPDATGVAIGRVRVVIARSPRGLTGTYEHLDAAGARQWTRTYDEPGATGQACKDVLQGIAVELAGELVVLEMELAEQPPPAPPEPAPVPPAQAPAAPSAPAPPPPPPPPSSSPRPQLEIGLSAFAGIGTAASVTAGGALHVAFAIAPFGHERARLSFAVEGRADTPATDARGFRTQVLLIALVACAHRELRASPTVTWGVLGCIVGMDGVLRGAWQGVDRAMPWSSTYAAAGGRFGVEVSIASVAIVRPQIEVLPTVHPARITENDHAASVGGVAGNAGVAIVFPF